MSFLQLFGSHTWNFLVSYSLGLASEYEHKVSFASLAFLSSPDNSAETVLAPLLTSYFEYLQLEWRSLVSKCEIERLLRTVLDSDLRNYFKNSVFHSVGHILNGMKHDCQSVILHAQFCLMSPCPKRCLEECRLERESLDNIALPPPWKENSFGITIGQDSKDAVDAVIKQYCEDPAMMKQARYALRKEIITVNGHPLPPSANSLMDVAEQLGQILKSNLSTVQKSKRKGRRSRPSFASDFGLELESEFSGTESDTSLNGNIAMNHVDVLARRLLIAASRMGTFGEAYLIV